jgi:hypothetical protein
MKHRVILVREWDGQMSGSGCCGRLGGVCDDVGEEATYRHVRVDMEIMGSLYRALREDLDPENVEISVVDPRNNVWLLPTLWRDGRARGLPVREILRQMRDASSQGAVVVDGLVVSHGGVPDVEEAHAKVLAELGAGATA